MMKNNLTLLTVRVSDQWFGIDLQYVIEVLWLVYLEDLPSTKPEILGLLNLREVTMPVVDLRILFQAPRYVYTMYTPLVAMSFSGRSIAIVVDEAYDIVSVNPHQVQHNNDSPYVDRVVQSGQRLIRLFKIDQLHAD